jgi:hypothetical protein
MQNHPGEVRNRSGLEIVGFSKLEALAAWWARFDAQSLGIKLNGEPSPEQARDRLEAIEPELLEARAILTALEKMKLDLEKRVEHLRALKLQAERVLVVPLPLNRAGGVDPEAFKALVKTLHPIQLESLLARLESTRKGATNEL